MYRRLSSVGGNLAGNKPTDGVQWKPDDRAGTIDCYVPDWLVEAARRAMGGIDFDPASCKQANREFIKATAYSKQGDGLKRPWPGRVFVRPPLDAWPAWITKLNTEITLGHTEQVILVGPADISAYRSLCNRNCLLLVPHVCLKYFDFESGKLIAPPYGSAVCYVGGRRKTFAAAFRKYGLILQTL